MPLFAAISVIALLVAAMLVGLRALFVTAEATATGRAEPRPAGTPNSGRLHASARVLFCEAEGDYVTLDCALVNCDLTSDERSPTGTPFTLLLRAPETAALNAAVAAILCDWASDEQIIDFEMSANGERAVLDNGSTRLYLLPSS